ncbi:MAG: hypothetical protein WCF57_09345 [Pyrinomonadaceae bacterium]
MTEETLSKPVATAEEKRSTPQIHTSKSGRRYAHIAEVILSPDARAEISLFAKISVESKETVQSDQTIT